MRTRLPIIPASLAICVLLCGVQAHAGGGMYDNDPQSGAVDVPASTPAANEDATQGAVILAAKRGQESYRSEGVYAHTGEDWRYSSDYIFGLTRFMPDSGLPKWGQWVTYPFAFVIDLVQLPVGALGGLYGD